MTSILLTVGILGAGVVVFGNSMSNYRGGISLTQKRVGCHPKLIVDGRPQVLHDVVVLGALDENLVVLDIAAPVVFVPFGKEKEDYKIFKTLCHFRKLPPE